VDQHTHQCFAIVPAAGKSHRMGEPKLLLPWGRAASETTVIDHVLSAWTNTRVSEVVVVVRRDDEPLRSACEHWPVTTLLAEAPRDMKASVQLGLSYLDEKHSPTDKDKCFVAPADLPAISSSVIEQLLDCVAAETDIVMPQFGVQPGHPTLIPWPVTREIFKLSDNEGVNAIVGRHPKTYVHFPASMAITDIDTPEEYRQARDRLD